MPLIHGLGAAAIDALRTDADTAPESAVLDLSFDSPERASAALTAIWQIEQARLERAAVQICRSRSAAEDVLQDAWIAVHTAALRLRLQNSEHCRAMCYSAVRSRAIDTLRKTRREIVDVDLVEQTADSQDRSQRRVRVHNGESDPDRKEHSRSTPVIAPERRMHEQFVQWVYSLCTPHEQRLVDLYLEFGANAKLTAERTAERGSGFREPWTESAISRFFTDLQRRATGKLSRVRVRYMTTKGTLAGLHCERYTAVWTLLGMFGPAWYARIAHDADMAESKRSAHDVRLTVRRSLLAVPVWEPSAAVRVADCGIETGGREAVRIEIRSVKRTDTARRKRQLAADISYLALAISADWSAGRA